MSNIKSFRTENNTQTEDMLSYTFHPLHWISTKSAHREHSMRHCNKHGTFPHLNKLFVAHHTAATSWQSWLKEQLGFLGPMVYFF